MTAPALPSRTQTVLVVDDERTILGLIERALAPRGVRCLTTTHPSEALEILAREPVDLMVTDIHMDGMTGVDLLERARTADPQLIVVLMTGLPTIDTAVRSLQARAYDYLTKPFQLEELLTVVDRGLEKQRLSRENAALKETLTLYQISQAVTAAVDEREVIRMVIESVAREIDAEHVSVYLLDTNHRLERWGGEIQDARLAAVVRGIAAAVVARGEPLVLPGEGAAGQRLIEGSARTAAAIPLRGRDGVVGVLVALREGGARTFDDGHVRAMTILAGNAVAVVENARHARVVIESRAGLVEANSATIGALVSALDAREHETHVHSIRVTEYALRLAREVNFPDHDVIDLKFGAMLHDIGKIGVSDQILLKPGPLTQDEWREMRRHPTTGHQILGGIQFLSAASEIVLAHHERFDGTGYPRGLAGEQIPLGARIFALVDTLDSMTSDRPYRKALPFVAAEAEIIRCRGTQFDPDLVDGFLRIPREEWLEIREEAANGRFDWDQLSLRGGFARGPVEARA